MDYFPLAQTTALGMKGGRIGLVQMGSPRKANKILGDIVLIVPEMEYSSPGGKRRRRSRRDIGPGMGRRGSIEVTVSPRGSRAKVEKLRGEKLPVGTFGEDSEFPRLSAEPMVEVGMSNMERKNSTGVESYMDRRSSVDRRTSMEKQNMDYRTSLDGRTSTEGRMNVESRTSIDRRIQVESRVDLERKATVESRASMDRRMNIESRASIDRMRTVESRASIDRTRTTDLERKPTVESRASIDRKESRLSFKRETQIESRASIDRRTTVESRTSKRADSRGSGSLERKGTLELNRTKSNGAVWII